MFSRHVTKDISAYCQGELSAEESRQFAEHVIACAKCRREFEEIKLGIRLAEQLPLVPAPEMLWSEIEASVGSAKQNSALVVKPWWQARAAAVAAVLLVVGGLGVWWFWTRGFKNDLPKGSWQVQSLNGAPRIGEKRIGARGQLGVGEWLETDGSSRAQIAVSSIGQVNIGENTRVRLVETEPTEHRLELARGKLSATIWAPPRLFFVDTPSAVAADLGCAYTLEVDDHGAGVLRVTAGWVALELKDRESMVPADAACETRPGVGPGTPYFVDAPASFRSALETVDFNNDAAAKAGALDVMLSEARARDTLTLWHLLARVEGNDRARIYDKIATFVPPPDGVTREGILKLDQTMLDRWKDSLEASWFVNNTIVPKPIAEGYWRVKNGITRRLKQ
ncbi:MAG TPA: FecR domain-containing protein [Pyrinomonadaceae bacterium]